MGEIFMMYCHHVFVEIVAFYNEFIKYIIWNVTKIISKQRKQYWKT